MSTYIKAVEVAVLVLLFAVLSATLIYWHIQNGGWWRVALILLYFAFSFPAVILFIIHMLG